MEFFCTRRLHFENFLDLNFFLQGGCLCSESFDARIVLILFFLLTLYFSFIFLGPFLRRPLRAFTIIIFREGPRKSKDVKLNIR